MGVYRLVKRAARFLIWAKRTRSLRWARALAHAHVPLTDVSTDTKGALLIGSRRLQLPWGPTSRDLIAGWSHLVPLLSEGAKFVPGTSDVEIDQVRIRCDTEDRLAMLWEVFVAGQYNLANNRPSVVMDIGANVGIASLYFARRGFLVYAYEPFPANVAAASANLDRNAELGRRVHLRPYALGARTETILGEYDEGRPGDSTTLAPRTRDVNARTVTVEVRDAAEEVLAVCRENPDKPLILKIDTEGAEAAILARLIEASVLDRVSTILMEWHAWGLPAGVGDLGRRLTSAGLTVVQLGARTAEVGMLYAVRSTEAVPT